MWEQNDYSSFMFCLKNYYCLVLPNLTLSLLAYPANLSLLPCDLSIYSFLNYSRPSFSSFLLSVLSHVAFIFFSTIKLKTQ